MAPAAKQHKKNTQSQPSATELSLSFYLGAFKFPLALVIGLVLIPFLPRLQANNVLAWSLWGAAAVLLAWQAVLLLNSYRERQTRKFTIALRPQHYIQAMVQVSVYAYWGYYWRPVYDHLWLIVAQLLFAYSFDMLLAWSRRREYSLGFGPVPIILSINLFIWFRDDWFYMQFLMIALGFMGKEYVRWQRDGRSAHIFNPSAFALGLFSLVLIATNTTGLTWGQEIASTLTLAPNIYAFLFIVGLIVMYFFSITLVAGMSAVTLFALSAIYSASTGVPYFLDSEIPAAVFLGIHLLITDPSTSPRTPLGKSLFGVLYAIGVFALYTILDALGAPTFYDKLLCVPLLNLSVIAIDRAVRSIRSESMLNVWRSNWLGGRANFAHMGIWIVIFVTMSLFGKTDGKHTGDSLPFWQQACTSDLSNACTRLLQLESTYCGDNAAWACNELGVQYREGNIVEEDEALSLAYFSRACELKFQASCLNLLDQDRLIKDIPHELDLRLLLREGGQNLMQLSSEDLVSRACEHDWEFACDSSRRQL
uniref:Beta-lactamase n=1 Tax=SAR86 cluster bacterium TaxID=2030880 RepID=A0A2A5B110_9GAMM